MSFTLNSSHINGGTFNNVSGNMSQVFNSNVVHIGADPHGGSAGGFLAPTGRAIGPIRPQQLARNVQPYSITNRSACHRDHGVEPPLLESSERGPQIPPMITDDVRGNGMVGNITGFTPPIRSTADEIYNPTNISNTFNSVGGDMTQLSVTSYGETGMDILYRSVVMEALHDSVERFPEPACHPGTRTAVLEDLKSWAVDTSPESMILWLHGCAGMGKSAIAQMFAGHCQAQGHLGASFFFRHGYPRQGQWHGLFTTLAYQLATSIPELLLPVQQAVEADKLVVGRAMIGQFRKLLVEPLKHALGLQFMPVIVLDGLDECADHKVQQQILRLFIDVIRSHQLPIRLLIASRPEPHIREILETEETSAICRHSLLSANNSAYQDIRIYLRDEFSRIHTEYMARGIDLGPSWPAPEEVEHLVQKSSGIFIYTTIVIRFIDDEYTHPADRLASVLSLDPRSTAPLNDLYTEILSVSPHEPQQLRILHAIWQGTLVPYLNLDLEQMDSLLVVRPGTSRLALRGLHSLFHVPPIRPRFAFPDVVRPLHASLGDYLADSLRSGKWCVATPLLASDYLHCLIRLLSSLRVTLRRRRFHSALIYGLPTILNGIAPTDMLVALLRNDQFQDSLFLSLHLPGFWPNRFGIPTGSDPTVGRS
ncbi:hypothetical protein FB451DRAFT_771118 [Mycena latifolia]|nr:hypothetical protein FB451DRAFT_771118 [Mycena latifolia]